MGAKNVSLAFSLYAGFVADKSLLMLLYMALVSKDSDPSPWYGLGHEALATMVLGKEKPTDNDLRQVRRYVKPLVDVGAVKVETRSYGRKGLRTKYLLNFSEPSQKLSTGQRVSGSAGPATGQGVSYGYRTAQYPLPDSSVPATGHTLSGPIEETRRRQGGAIGEDQQQGGVGLVGSSTASLSFQKLEAEVANRGVRANATGISEEDRAKIKTMAERHLNKDHGACPPSLCEEAARLILYVKGDSE